MRVWRAVVGAAGLILCGALAWPAQVARPLRAARAPQVARQAPPPAAGEEKAAPALAVPPAAETAIRQIYAGNPGAAITAAQRLEAAHPADPLGHLIEAEARWWQLYCEQNQVEYGMVDLWRLPGGAPAKPYLEAARKVVALAQAELAKKETAQAHLWAGMGYALQARLDGVRGEKMATARAGVKARNELLRALALDPRLADANTGLGLYNYYVDTLSPIVKLLRFFLGIPGGSKREGVRQLRAAMDRGQITSVEARFYLAKNLRTYDHNYAEALAVAEPLVRAYPDNPVFLLLVANLEIELGRKQAAQETLARIGRLKLADGACVERSEQLARRLGGAGR